MASGSILAASGLEPLQSLFQSLAGLLLLLSIFAVVGSTLMAIIRVALPLAIARISGSSIPPGGDPFSSAAPARSFDLATKLRSIDWFQFEKLIEIVYRKQGYLVDRRGGANPDGGIDLVLIKDTDKIAVQCKHWRKWAIGVPKIRELVGAMTDAKISKGILVTTSDYTDGAKTLADRNGIEIINHAALMKLLDSIDAACDRDIQALLNDTRKFCPKCERLMVLRTAKRGDNIGTQFWGCSGFPDCWHREQCA